MIHPVNRLSDYLEFECDKCKSIFHHAVKISHDAPAESEAAKFDVGNWAIMRIDLRCPNCGAEESLKMVLREDLAKKPGPAS
jgi:hypothetical protein